MTEKNKSPEIRFKGFTDKWEERKLEEIADILDGDRGNNYPNGNELQDKGHTLFLSATNVTTNGFKFDKTQYITEEKSNSLGNGKLIVDDIVLTSRGSVGHIAWYNKAIQQRVSFARINSGMLILRSKDFVMPCFVTQFLKSPLGKKQINLITFGSAQPQLTKRDASNYIVSLPSDSIEQRKLGDFFQQLDNLITLRQRKLDKLGTIKKSMLEKMFPKNGALVPEIRFNGFVEPWEERKLGEIVTFINGRAYSQNELLNKGKYKVLRVGNFYTNDSWYYSDMELGEKYYANKGDLLYTWSASFGPHIWHGDKVIYHYHIWKLELSEHLDYFFSVHLLNNDKKKILNDKNGSTMVHITKAGMEQKFVLIPKIEEQNKITSFLDNLDQLTTLQQRELEKLKNIKKACLEKMFV